MNLEKTEKRKPRSFSLSDDIIAKLEEYARNHHTNKSQAVTDLIWKAYEQENFLQSGISARNYDDDFPDYMDDKYYEDYLNEDYFNEVFSQMVLVDGKFQFGEEEIMGEYLDMEEDWDEN